MVATEEQKLSQLPVNVRRETSLDRFLSRRKRNRSGIDPSGGLS